MTGGRVSRVFPTRSSGSPRWKTDKLRGTSLGPTEFVSTYSRPILTAENSLPLTPQCGSSNLGNNPISKVFDNYINKTLSL